MDKEKYIIRRAVKSDAKAFLALWEVLDRETEFLLYEPGERKVTLKMQREQLSRAQGSENSHILVLSDSTSDTLYGFTAGRRSSNARDKHTLDVVIGMCRQATGKGLGFEMLSTLERWAKIQEVARMQLSVLVTNTNALKLYKKLGYVIEGERRGTVKLSSGYVNEYVMGKWIADES